MQALIDRAAQFLCEHVEANWAPVVVKDWKAKQVGGIVLKVLKMNN